MRKRHSLMALIGLIALLLAALPAQAALSPQVPFPSTAIPQFAQPLPVLDVAGGSIKTVDGTQPATVSLCEFDANVLPPGTFAPGVQPRTRVWGYIPGDTCPPNGPTDPPLDTFTGPVVLATRDTATQMTFLNQLGTTATTQVLAYKYSTDQTLHWADPLNGEANDCNMAGGVPAFGSDCAQNYDGPIPAAVHLHGGEVPPELDGGPDAWFTSDGAYQGHGYYTRDPVNDPANGIVYNYPNTQEASPIWFHDHTLGATRLNVYAGLAGGYLIQDPALVLPAGLAAYGLDNGGAFEPTVPLVIQDRMFDTNGQLFFPADSAGNFLWSPNPEHPYWVPEFIGDTILVNGKAWPYFDVQPKRYRFLFLNGSNARTYEMYFIDPAKVAVVPNFWVIATDGGYLDKPVMVKKLVMQPGERYEAIIDFAGLPAGTNLILKNTAKTPFPNGIAPKGGTVGQIMQFRVGAGPVPNNSYNPAGGVPLRTGTQIIQRLVDPVAGKVIVPTAKTRLLTLNEVMGMPQVVTDPVTGIANTAYPGGPLEILVNNTKWSGDSPRTYGDFTPISVGGITTMYSELPQEGQTEVWEIVNLTADAHPIHLHLVQFQLVNRQNFDVPKYNTAYAAAFPAGVFQPDFGPPKDYRAGNNPLSGGKDGGNPDVLPYLKGKIQPPAANEAGWKDTVIAYPGQVTRIAVRWAPTYLPALGADPSELYFPFDPSGGYDPIMQQGGHGYVWHCHIIDHEDNEMMRPDLVVLNPAAPVPGSRPLVKGVDY